MGDGPSHRLVVDLSSLVPLLGTTSTLSGLSQWLVDAGVDTARLPNPMRAEKLSAKQRSFVDRRLGLTLEFAARSRFRDADRVVGDGSLVLTGFAVSVPSPDFDAAPVSLRYPFGLTPIGSREFVHERLGTPVYSDSAGDRLFTEDFVHGDAVISFRYDQGGRYEEYSQPSQSPIPRAQERSTTKPGHHLHLPRRPHHPLPRTTRNH